MEGKPKPTAVDERTNVVDIHSHRYETDLTLQILDFGGQEVYNITKHLWITEKSQILLVFDLVQLSEGKFDQII